MQIAHKRGWYAALVFEGSIYNSHQIKTGFRYRPLLKRCGRFDWDIVDDGSRSGSFFSYKDFITNLEGLLNPSRFGHLQIRKTTLLCSGVNTCQI